MDPSVSIWDMLCKTYPGVSGQDRSQLDTLQTAIASGKLEILKQTLQTVIDEVSATKTQINNWMALLPEVEKLRVCANKNLETNLKYNLGLTQIYVLQKSNIDPRTKTQMICLLEHEGADRRTLSMLQSSRDEINAILESL